MKDTLKKYFGYDEFRPGQDTIIQSVLDGQDSFVLMPTGGGKSLCFQLPALMLPGITLVISPLIALMKDQVDSLKSNGIAAEFINSSLSHHEIDEVMARAKNNEIKLLYIAPERFALGNFIDVLKNLDISLVAIDEAHCISEWGHDFRPDYRNLSTIKKHFPGTPLIALTATATEKVREDILRNLQLKKPKVFVSSFDRENLEISVINKKQAFVKLVKLLDDYRKESVIIYAHSRKEAEELAENLRLNKFNARAYHAGFDASTRKLVQEQFVKDKINIIVATIAFGMGIDKPDVRMVIHYTFPKTLEGYYQEIGRAGRDGLPSKCVLFYTYADLRRHEFFIGQMSDPSLAEIANMKLSEVLNFCELTTCRKKYLLKYFGEDKEEDKCQACDVCTTKKEMMDATEISKKILSAVVRCENRFGRNHVVDVLLGKKTQKIRQRNHDQLSVHGIAKKQNKDELNQIIKQLSDLDYLQKSEGEYPVLKITKKGALFLQSDEKLELVKPVIEFISEPKKKTLDYDIQLFEMLRQKRAEVAEKNGVPPFIIFGDKSLQEMAYYFPENEAEFSHISGVGAKKLENLAPKFLPIIKQYCQENNVEKNKLPEKDVTPKTKVKIKKPKFHHKTKELLQKKIPIERIAKNQNLKPTTIINHIEKLIDEGEKLDLDYLKLPKDRFEIIKQAFHECGDEYLKPVYEHLNGKYEYNDIKLVRVLLRS